MTIPMNPGEPGEATYLSSNDDVVGILSNGVLLDSHEATWAYDSCNGHSDSNHQYHYHIPPQCLLQAMGVTTPDNTEWWIDYQNPTTAIARSTGGIKSIRDYSEMAAQWPANASASPVIGFARDGYPIFGPYDENEDLQRGMDYGGDLDECNGKMNSAGSYGYYLTVDPPFAPPCLRGERGLFTSLSSNKMCPMDGIANTIIDQNDIDNANCRDVSEFGELVECIANSTSMSAESSIAFIASNTENLSILDMALLATGLDYELDGASEYTMFAPSDEAFEALGEDVLDNLLTNDVDYLTSILKYHVVAGSLHSDDTSGSVLTTLNGANLLFANRNNIRLNEDTRVTENEIEASNGFVDIIDKVLIPPGNLVDTVFGLGEFYTLVGALEKFEDLVSKLSTDGPYTIFAPPDSAFKAIENVVAGLTSDELLTVLLHHVTEGNIASFDLVEGDTITMLSGQTVTVGSGFRPTLRKGDVYRAKLDDTFIIDYNMMASNGIIHTVEEVLIPTM